MVVDSNSTAAVTAAIDRALEPLRMTGGAVNRMPTFSTALPSYLRFAIVTASDKSVQNWKQGRRRPERAAPAFLKVIDREPDAVRRTLPA